MMRATMAIMRVSMFGPYPKAFGLTPEGGLSRAASGYRAHMTLTRKFLAGMLGLSVVLFPVACSDEDNDGSTTDEEVDQLDEKSEDVGDELEEEVDEGRDEVNN
jgi:hypothetical protein